MWNWGTLPSFADYFFDGLFADLFVQSRIREAQDQVAAVAQRVERLIVRLRDERENLEEKQGQLDWSGSACSPPRTGPSSRAERRQGRRSPYERAGDPSELD